jgi:hypothetical protein
MAADLAADPGAAVDRIPGRVAWIPAAATAAGADDEAGWLPRR